ncbi:hypothetical protein MHYP_G00167430 [Metynnis hypsauchen]
MDTLQKRQVEQTLHDSSPSSSSVLAPGSLPRPGPSREQSPKAEPTDDELMACSLEVDIPGPCASKQLETASP